MKNLMTTLACIALLGLAGCESDGPAEQFGENVDEATEELRSSADNVGNDLEDACEEIKEGVGAKDTDC